MSCFLISRGLRSDVEWKLARAEDKSKPRNDEFLLSMLLATTVCTYVHFAYNCVRVWVCVTRKDNVVIIHSHEKERIHECVIYCLYVCVRGCVYAKARRTMPNKQLIYVAATIYVYIVRRIHIHYIHRRRDRTSFLFFYRT